MNTYTGRFPHNDYDHKTNSWDGTPQVGRYYKVDSISVITQDDGSKLLEITFEGEIPVEFDVASVIQRDADEKYQAFVGFKPAAKEDSE